MKKQYLRLLIATLLVWSSETQVNAGVNSTFVDPATGSASPAITLGSEYVLEFSDEFNDGSIDPTKWSVLVSSRSRTARPEIGIDDWWWVAENAYEESGNLVMRVTKHDFNTMYCGSVNSNNLYEKKYGYYETSMQIAETAKGTHTAFWFQGDNQGNINNSGNDGAEVDVFESAWLGDFTKAVVHIDGYGSNKQALTQRYDTPGLHTGYHTFGLLWQAGSMEIYYDGTQMVTYTGKWVPETEEYIWLSDGATFGLTASDLTFSTLPDGVLTHAYADYVRVWRISSDDDVSVPEPEHQVYWTDYADNTFTYNGGTGQVLEFITTDDASNISTNYDDWFVASGNPNNQQVTASHTAINLTGYPENGRGNVMRISTLNSQGTDKNNNVQFDRRIGNPTGAQTIYMSLKMNMFRMNSYAADMNRETFSIGLSEVINDDATPANTTSTWGVKLYARHINGSSTDRSGQFQLGIQKEGGEIVYDSLKTYTANGSGVGDAAIFVLIKVSMDGNNGNDSDFVQMYSSTTVPVNEPETWGAATADGNDINLNAVFIREKMETAKQDHFMEFSGIRVADSWDAVLGSIWDGSTWSLGEPTADINAVVNGGLTLTSDLTVNDLVVKSGETMTVNAGNTLDIKGDVHTDGILTIASGASLMTYDGNDVESVTINRNSSFTDAQNRYSFIGSPVSALEIETLNSGHHYTYTTSSDTYASFNGVMESGIGYTSAGKQALVFSGVPNAGDITVTLDNTGNKFNLVSNPYAAAIDRADFVAANANITGAIYLWDDGGSDVSQRSGDDFITVTNAGSVGASTSGGSGASFNQYIGAAQGFFVQASAAGDVLFSEDMRVSGNNADANYFRKDQQDVHTIRLELSGENKRDETLITFSSNGSNGFDKGWDARKLRGQSDLFIYSLLDEEAMAIQTLGMPVEQNGQVKLGLEIPESGEYNITLTDVLLPENTSLYLRDALNDDLITLTQAEKLSFTIDESSMDRFSLVIGEALEVLSVGDDLSSLAVTHNNGLLEIVSPRTLDGSVEVVVLNMNGQEVYSHAYTTFSGSVLKEAANLVQGQVYVLKLSNDDNEYTSKFIIN